MLNAILSLFRMILLILGGHEQVALENLALREQLTIFQRSVRPPRIRPTDRLFWVCLRKVWKEWKSALVIVRPETVLDLWFAKTRSAFKGLKLAKLDEESISHRNPLNNSIFGLTTPV